VFIYPLGIPTKFPGSTKIEIPEYWRYDYDKGVGVVLSIGPGIISSKGKFRKTQLEVGDKVVYNKEVPWKYEALGTDGNMYNLILCGEQDIWVYLDDEH